MALQECLDLIGLLIGPTKVASDVFGNLSRRNFVRQYRDRREYTAGVPAKVWKETVGEQHGENDNREIGFQDVGTSQVSEEQRMALQESHDRVNQICEQDRKGKNDDDSARHVDDGKYNREKKDCQ